MGARFTIELMTSDRSFCAAADAVRLTTTSVDIARVCAPLARWLTTPLTGFVILGSNGEAALLDEDESDRVVATRARWSRPAGR